MEFYLEKRWEVFLARKHKEAEAGGLSPSYIRQLESYSRRVLEHFKGKDVREIRKGHLFFSSCSAKEPDPGRPQLYNGRILTSNTATRS